MGGLFIGKDQLLCEKKYVAVLFQGKRKVLSTGPLNGGLRTDLEAVFNLHGGKTGEPLYGDTYEDHMRAAAGRDLGLDPCTCTGIMTAASMENVARSSLSYENLWVTALVTGGIEVNAGRVGESAFLLFIGADLTEGAMERALVTCTEAKTAAIQELCICSRYSSGLATGSGTDGTIIIADMESDLVLTEAGKHCKLGELIGRTVKEAVKEALFLQTGVDSHVQHNAFRRMERWGLTADSLWEYGIRRGLLLPGDKKRFFQKADSWARKSDFVLWSLLEAHLLDEYSWGLIEKEELERGEKKLRRMYSSEISAADKPEQEEWLIRQFW